MTEFESSLESVHYGVKRKQFNIGVMFLADLKALRSFSSPAAVAGLGGGSLLE